MLDAAMANYGGLLVMQALKGPEAAERYRRGIEGTGGARDAIRLIAAGFDKPLSDLPHGAGYYGLSDSKGYLVYAMLAGLIGQSRMRAALHRLTAEHAYSTLDWATFLQVIREEAGRNIDWFISQWFDRAGIPVISHEWSQRGRQLVVTIGQQAPAYRLELPLQLTFADGSASVRTVAISQPITHVTFDVLKPVSSINLDPGYYLLHASPAEIKEATALQYATRGQLLWDNGDTPGGAKELEAGLAHHNGIEANAAEFLERLYLGWIANEAGRTDEAIAHYERALSLPVRSPELLARAYLNLAKILAKKGDRTRAVAMAQAAIAAEEAQGKPTYISARAQTIIAP